MERKFITAQEVREYRDRTGTGMYEAKAILQAQKDKEYMEWLRNATIEEKIDFLMECELVRINGRIPKY